MDPWSVEIRHKYYQINHRLRVFPGRSRGQPNDYPVVTGRTPRQIPRFSRLFLHNFRPAFYGHYPTPWLADWAIIWPLIGWYHGAWWHYPGHWVRETRMSTGREMEQIGIYKVTPKIYFIKLLKIAFISRHFLIRKGERWKSFESFLPSNITVILKQALKYASSAVVAPSQTNY